MKPLLLISLLMILLSACSEQKITPEDEIKNYIESAKLAAENRSHNDLANLIDEQYKDQKGLDKKRLKNMARAYFLMHRNINLFIKIDSIEFQDSHNAFVVLHVAMTGKAIKNLGMLSSLRAKLYKFELQLNKEDQWLLQQARWKTASLNDML